jgi:inosine-uridine nucleoside N-ribohydrolase
VRLPARSPGRWPAILALAAASCAGAAPGPRAVLLTTDTGCEIDDQWTVAYLVLAAVAGEIDLRGIVTTHAPNLAAPAAEASAAEARRVAALFAPDRLPRVVPGESTAIAPGAGPRGGPGARFIVEEARRSTPEDRLTVLAIGAATDVAEALLLDPAIAERMKVIAVGFEDWPRGGDPWNVKNDPHAYRILLAADVPLAVGCGEVCTSHLTLDARAAAQRLRGGGPGGEYLQGQFDAWLRSQEPLCRQTTGRAAWVIWDLIAVAHLQGWTESEDRPRPRLRDDLTFDHGGAQGTLRWITSVDDPRLWTEFRRLLDRV